jgi:hypothetical protein
MALVLEIHCSNHQRRTEPKVEGFVLRTINKDARQRLKEYLESKGWVVQFNGEHMDTYCSKECAR